MNEPAAYTHLESLFLLQSLLTHGVDSDGFARVSEALTNNALVRSGETYDAERLKPEPLRQHCLFLLEDETRREAERADGATDGSTSPGTRKRKLGSMSPLSAMVEAAKYVEKLPGLIERLYTQYRDDMVEQIREDERRFKVAQSQIKGLEKIERERLAKVANAGQNNAAALAAQAAKPMGASHAVASPTPAPMGASGVKRGPAAGTATTAAAAKALAAPGSQAAATKDATAAVRSSARVAPPAGAGAAGGQTPTAASRVLQAPGQSVKASALSRPESANKQRDESVNGASTNGATTTATLGHVLKWEKPYQPLPPSQTQLGQSAGSLAQRNQQQQGAVQYTGPSQPKFNVPHSGAEAQQASAQYGGLQQPGFVPYTGPTMPQGTSLYPTLQQPPGSGQYPSPQQQQGSVQRPSPQQHSGSLQHPSPQQGSLQRPSPPQQQGSLQRPSPPQTTQSPGHPAGQVPGVAASQPQSPRVNTTPASIPHAPASTPHAPGQLVVPLPSCPRTMGGSPMATANVTQGRGQPAAPVVPPGLGRAIHSQQLQQPHPHYQQQQKQQLQQPQQPQQQVQQQQHPTPQPMPPTLSQQQQAQQPQHQQQAAKSQQQTPRPVALAHPPSSKPMPSPSFKPMPSPSPNPGPSPSPKPMPSPLSRPMPSPSLKQAQNPATAQSGQRPQSLSHTPVSNQTNNKRNGPQVQIPSHTSQTPNPPPRFAIPEPIRQPAETPDVRHGSAANGVQTPRSLGPIPYARGLGTRWAPCSTPSTPKPTATEPESPAYEPSSPGAQRPPPPDPRFATPRNTVRKVMPKPVYHTDTKVQRQRSRGGGDAGTSAMTPSLRTMRRSLSLASQTDELSLDHSAFATRVKKEGGTPRGHDETGDTTADESITGRVHMVTPGSVTSRLAKRKRLDSPIDALVPPTQVLWTRGFTKVSSSALDQISSHRYANMFATGVRERDAPNYRQIVLQPQDIASIRAAIKQGNKAAMQAASCLPGGGDPGTANVWLPMSEDLVPPRGIINSAQLERELVHIFCNAIMYNPDPNRGPGAAFMKRSANEEEEVVGYHLDENGVVKNTRSMFVEVEKLLGELRSAEKDRGAAAVVRQASASPADDTAEDEDELAGDGGGAGAAAVFGGKRRRVSMRASLGQQPSSAVKTPASSLPPPPPSP